MNTAASPFAAQQHLLRERLLLLLGTLSPALRADCEVALASPGKLLSGPGDSDISTAPDRPAGVWPLLTLLVAQSLSPGIEPGIAAGVAVATECLLCASDLLDDVEDDDRSAVVEQLGAARALNTSTALLMLAQRALLDASCAAFPLEAIRLLSALVDAVLTAAGGQHGDLLAESRPVDSLTEEECIDIAAAKAGALMGLACRLGALCAGAPAGVCEQYAQLGHLLGIAHQLDNDAHDASAALEPAPPSTSGRLAGKSDLRRAKKTLPFVLAAQNALQISTEDVDGEKRQQLALQHGVLESWSVALLYRERAQALARSLAGQGMLSIQLLLLLGLASDEAHSGEEVAADP
jgi:geranylgeranyl pyrophosphate synthase